MASLLAATALGLLAAHVVGATGMRSFLDQQVDKQLGIALNRVPDDIDANSRLTKPLPPEAGTCAFAVLDASGAVLSRFGATEEVPLPRPDELPRYAATTVPVTVTARDDHRMRVARISGDRFLVVSYSLKWSDSVLHRLIAIELVVSGISLALVGAVAVRMSAVVLRPLDRMTATAGRIADGELSHRVDLEGSPGEVADLGRSLNQMLGSIENAFSQRQVAEERLRRFVADASHELRTPLTSITGYAQLFRKGMLADPASLADAMTRVENEARRMSSLVDELLLLARLDQGRPLERMSIDLAELVTTTVEDARAADPGRSLRVVVEPGEHLVRGDGDRLRQVVENLVMNVRAHTPAGTDAEVRITRAGVHEVVDVVDAGPGIDLEQRERVFERFYRADSARHRITGTSEGNGLGLSIVAAIAEAHGGTASVQPHDGGAWLRVVIPSATPMPEPTAQTVPSGL